MEVQFEGRTFSFPDDATDDEISSALEGMSSAPAAAAPEQQPAAEPSELERETARIASERQAKPTVPLSGETGWLTPEQEAQSRINQREREKAERELYESRDLNRRVEDTSAFILSAPVRALSRGEYGAGDIASGLGYEDLAKTLSEGEQGFAWANQSGLETAAALGEVTAGIPFLNTMGGVPGQMTRTMNATVKDFPRVARNFIKDERGAMILPGKGPNIHGGRTATTVDEAAEGARTRHGPTRSELIATGKRISDRLPEGENFAVPRMVAGNAMERHLAGGVATIPWAGTPVLNEWEKGIFGLGRAKDMLRDELGDAGQAGAGSAIRSRVSDWMKNPTALDETEIGRLYDEVGKSVKDVPVELSNLRRLDRNLATEKGRSTTKEHDAARALISDMLDRKQFPKGMPYKDLLQKRKEIGARTSGKIVNEAGTSQTTLDRIYGAMTEDLKFAIKRGGGQKALDKWEEANTSAQNVADQRKVLARLIGERGEVPPEKVVARIKEMGRSRRGDITALRILDRILPEQEFNDLAATLVDDLGKNRKGEFSIFQFSTDYGQMSEAAKRLLLKGSKQAADDIVDVVKAYERLHGQSWNTSKTGVAQAVLQLVMNPISVLGLTAGALTDIGTMGAAGGTMAGFRGARSMAWALSKPAVAREASSVFRAYYRVARGGGAIAKREQGLSAAIRSYSMALAAETGGNAGEIERAIQARLAKIRRDEQNRP